MRSAVFCYALQDSDTARELGSFLELNCRIAAFYEEGAIRPGSSLLDAVDRGISADLTLVLLSPASTPGAWKREKWEPILFDKPAELGTHIAFLLLSECKFPELLRRRHFFDLSRDRLTGERELKRWVLALDDPIQCASELPEPGGAIESGVLEELRRRIADRPGLEMDLAAEVALAFVHAFKKDFHGVFWVDCGNRSRAGILGDTAHALGLRLPGTAEQNRIALSDFCAAQRCLFVFQNVAPEDRDALAFKGKASAIFVAPSANPVRRSPEETLAIFARWPERVAECLSSLGDLQAHLRVLLANGAESWPAANQLGSTAVTFLRHCERFVEAYELLDMMTNAAGAVGDTLALYRLGWEQRRILEHWGELVPPAPVVLPEPAQLSLEFETPKSSVSAC